MIFKTINSSVDETRKTLALFNKDWSTYKRNWQNANGVFGKIGSVFTPANAITKSDIEAIKAYNSQIDSCVTSQTAFNRTMLNASPAAQNLVASYNGGKVSAQGMATAQNAAKASTIGLTIAQTALNAAIGMGIGLLISLVVKGIDKLVHANEEAIEKAEELRRKYEKFKSTNESNISTLNGLKKEFEELSKGVSQYGDNVSLTTEQYERYKEIIQQIVGMSPSLAEGYNAENGYIADKNGLLERAIELQEQEYRNELRKITNLQNLKTSMAGYIAEYKDAFEGGWATVDMSATSTVKATDFSSALYKAFNYSERYNDGYSSEDLAREILKSLGIDNIDKEMEKFFNGNGYYQPNWFFDEYVDEIAKNIDAVTNALSYENVGLEEDEFENRILTVKDCAQAYLDMKDSISMANESIQRDLQHIAEYTDGYSNLTTEQQKFVNEFLKGFNIDDIVSRDWFGNLTYDEDKMKSVKRQITDFVEALSQDETTKSALADLYAIPTDEQSVSEFVEQFRNALEVIKTYCQENGIEIPISITESEQSINDLETQYQSTVAFAKERFNGYDPTSFFEKHSINTQEEIDAWQEIAQGATNAAEAEKKYIQSLTTHTPTPFPQAWTASFTSDNESVRELGNTLLELAEQGRLTIETFNNADSSDYFKNLGISADEAVSKINRMADESQQLASMANQISSMSEALDTKQAEGFVSADVLSGFDAEVRGLESWDKFQTFLGSVSTSYDECQEAASALASEWINNSDFLAQLTEENKEYYATQLEAMGIENYEEIISYAQSLNEAKEALAQANEMSGEATQDEIEALIAEGAYSELTAGLILQLYDAKIAEKALTLDTSADCEELIALAGDADKTSRSIQLLLQLKDIYNGFESGIYDGNRLLREEALAEVDRIKGELEELANGESENSITMPGVTLGNKGTSAAKSAGRDAGDAYVDAFEKELEDLKDLRDRGTITEKAYLDEFRRLYQRYYRDKKKYAEEYAKYEHEYLQGMKSLYESALSGITSMLDKQIGTYEDQKSAAVDSLEAERDARIEVLETQKEQYEEQIKLIDEQIEAKEKIIDGINEEINAIKDANEQRKREIDLEKSKYELERMMNQRTILQYSADKGMHYTQDTDGVRDARQTVEDAELEIEIAGKEEQIKLIEKEIDLLEERKESINEQIDLLDVQIDQINKQYDQMIAETEQYWDSIIQGMEDYKSRWQELGEIEEQAKLTATLEQLGISTNDILNMSGEAFARFKEEYLGLLADIYSGNNTMLSGLSDAAGINTEALGSYLEATQQYIDGLNGLGEAISPVSDAIGAVTGALTGGSSSGGQGTDGTDTGTDTGTGGLVGAMNSLKEATDEALGSGGDESASDGTGAIGKFGQLKGAVTDVTAAIGSDTSETSGESVSGEQTDGTSENGKGLIGSVGNLGQKTEEILGEPDGEGVTGRFGQLSEVIGQAKDYVHEMLEGLRDIDGETFECTIKINVDMNGELPGAISGTISSKIQAGVRNFSNSKPVRDDTPHISSGLSSQSAETTAAEPVTADIMTAAETSTVGIIPVAGTSTVGVMPTAESEPEISAFSPESFRNGAEPLPTQKDGSLLRPIGPGERAYELHKAFEPLLEKADDSFEYLSGNAMITHTRLIEKMVRDITAANMITNNKNIQPNIRIGDIRITCPGVTSREVAAQVGSELNRLFSGFHLYTEQQSAIR